MTLDLWCVSMLQKFIWCLEWHTNLGQDFVLLGLGFGHCARWMRDVV